MDVGAPSNMERVRDLYSDVESLRRDVRVVAADDDTIRRIIAEGPSRWGTVWDPHTATAVHARETLGDAHWIVVATAHPAKFETVVEPLVGTAVEVPPSLERILSRPSRALEIEAELEPFRNAMTSGD
jgi:threonine synthase